MADEEPQPPAGQKPAAEATNPLTGLLTTITGALGLTISVASLDRDRVWILVAVLIGLVGAAGVLSSVKVVKVRKRLYAAGVALIVIACALLVLAPARAEPKPPHPDPSPMPTPTPTPVAKLEKTQVDITGGTDGRPVALDVTLRNSGTAAAALTRATLTIRDFAYLPVCFEAGSIQAGATYPLALPDRPTAGTSKVLPLHEEVPPGQYDRSPIRLLAPPFRVDATNTAEEASFVYVVDLSVGSDSAQPVQLGSYVVSLPSDPGNASVWNLEDPDRLAHWAPTATGGPASGLPAAERRRLTRCLDANSQALTRLLATDAQRSDHLGAVMTSPQD